MPEKGRKHNDERRRDRPRVQARPPEPAPAPGSAAWLLDLQRTAGNKAARTVVAEAPRQREQVRSVDQAVATAAPVMRSPVSVDEHAPCCGVQRHVAFEHFLLGQVAPGKLASIPMVREIPTLEAQINDLVEQGKLMDDPEKTRGLIRQLSEAKGRQDEARHTIEQEMTRLETWMSDSDPIQVAAGDVGKVEKNEDGTWQVPYVVLPARDGSVVVTYSEINTLPDLFGNPEAIAQTPRAKVISLVQGVRQQSYIELDNLYKELFGESRSRLSRWGLPDKDFADATGPRSQALIDKVYEIRTESQVNKATTRKGEEQEQYFAALERNACHFAPESWEQWQGYHTNARKLAQQSADAKAAAADVESRDGNPETADAYKEVARQKSNEAMLQNAFGEHYLQDSFAAGHLIDKTKIMQWFVEYLNRTGGDMGTFDTAQTQWSMATTTSEQPFLRSNPQAFHDAVVRGEIKSLDEANEMLGMVVMPEIVFMMWWRAESAKGRSVDLNGAEAAKACPLGGIAGDAGYAAELIERLKRLKFAEKSQEMVYTRAGAFPTGAPPGSYHLDTAMVDVARGGGAYESFLQPPEGQEHDYYAEAQEFNINAYNQFLHNAYIQASTKFFHDKFCKEGLWIKSNENVKFMKIYGDLNMLKAGAQEGVEYSAETSQMSREAIFNIVDGHPELAASAPDIRKRFPAHVWVPPTKDTAEKWLPIDKWNEQLKAWGDAGLFKEAKDKGALVVYKAKTGISSEGPLDLNALAAEVKKATASPQHGQGF